MNNVDIIMKSMFNKDGRVSVKSCKKRGEEGGRNIIRDTGIGQL